MTNIGFRIVHTVERVDSSIVANYTGAKLPTPNIADVMGRFNAIGQGIHTFNRDDVYMAGPAFTVRTHPSDNLMVHKAIDMAQPGDVIVVEAGGDMSHAILGELMCLYAKSRGIKGFVVDGPVRDGVAIKQMGYPVFAKGLSPRGPYKEGPGEINVPISCGGMPVSPGDLVIGDSDGVVVVPREAAGEIFEKAVAVRQYEEKVIQQIANGQWDRSWVDETLLGKGFRLQP
jgi:regulator of RNase E activity RraA